MLADIYAGKYSTNSEENGTCNVQTESVAEKIAPIAANI